MWSDKYYYLNLYKNEELSFVYDTKELRDFINRIPELYSVNNYEFTNTESFPFTQLLLLNVESLNNWTKSETHPEKTNLITIVCGKGEQIDFNELKGVFIKIASYLKWNLVEEETDEGIENYIIWKPEE